MSGAPTRSRQLTPEETIEAVTRVAAHVPVQVVADDLGVPADVVRSAVARAKASREARGAIHAARAEATPRVRNGLDTDVVFQAPAPQGAVAAPAAPAPKDDEQEPNPPQPALEPAAAAPIKSVGPADLHSFEELVDWGRASGIHRAAMLADRVEASADELRKMARRADEIQVRQKTIEVLERQLQKAKNELDEFTGARSIAARDGASTSAIRAWAIENGYEVESRGLLKHAIVEAYHAAHAPAGAS